MRRNTAKWSGAKWLIRNDFKKFIVEKSLTGCREYFNKLPPYGKAKALSRAPFQKREKLILSPSLIALRVGGK
jgi:hypothetical protein